MKYIATTAIVCFLFAFCAGCKKGSRDLLFSYEKAAGIWVPYQAVYVDGTIANGPFTAGSFFGVYAESVKINADRSFIPVIWNDPGNFILKPDEKGILLYHVFKKKLFFDGFFLLEFNIVKFEGSELWLERAGVGVTYKFKKEL